MVKGRAELREETQIQMLQLQLRCNKIKDNFIMAYG